MRFRKRPVEVEARLFMFPGHAKELAEWCGGYEVNAGDDTWIDIPTLEGMMAAKVGDWIIRGVAGEFYPCKPEIFEKTYEMVEP